MKNRLAAVDNKYQNIKLHPRVLCVCSAGLLRSPTIALVLAMEYGYNTRSAGTEDDFALTLIDRALLEWADEIVCAEDHHKEEIFRRLDKFGITGTPVISLDIPDNYSYRDPALMHLIRARYGAEKG